MIQVKEIRNRYMRSIFSCVPHLACSCIDCHIRISCFYCSCTMCIQSHIFSIAQLIAKGVQIIFLSAYEDSSCLDEIKMCYNLSMFTNLWQERCQTRNQNFYYYKLQMSIYKSINVLKKGFPV
jgi:hypothetical protein